jgi:hypothetical protein
MIICIIDTLYRNMAIIACSSIAVILCWVIRWEHPLSDLETATIAAKHRSTLSILPNHDMMIENSTLRDLNANNVSCTSVLTCVEPSLRDV